MLLSSDKTENLNGDGITVYKERWSVLAVFAALVMANALLWVTFAPISDLTQHYFNVNSSYGTTTSVNMLANIFLILYAPGSVLGVMLVKRYQPRNTILFASVLTALGALLRYIGTACFNDIGYANAYIIVFLGQTLAAIAQPMFLNFPPALASIWFPTSEREIATTIGSMCSPIGNAIGQIIPIIFVEKTNVAPDDDDVYDVTGMSDLMLVEFILCLLPLIAAYFIFKDAPPTPPSQSTKLKIDQRKVNRERQLLTVIAEEGGDDESDASRSLVDKSSSSSYTRGTGPGHDKTALISESSWYLVKKEVALLAKNKDYLILFVVFSIGVGFFNAILTLLNQIIEPFGYSNDDAGTFGAVFILAGLAGAGVVGKIMETTKAYKTLLRIGIALCCVFTTLLLLMLYSDNFWPLCVGFALMGMFVLPLLPVMMENCAECTYPVAEEVSMGVLFAGCNILGLAFIFAIQYLIEVPRFAPPPFLPANFFMLGVLLVAAFLLLFYDGEYKRMKHEKMEHMEDSSHAGESLATYHPPSSSSYSASGASSQAADDSSLVRVTDNTDNSLNQSMTNNSTSMNFWNSRSTNDLSSSQKQKRHNPPKEVLVNAANSQGSGGGARSAEP